MTNQQLRAGALFSGIGGFCVGFQHHGVETSWAVENDTAAVTTYESNLGAGKVLHGDGAPLDIGEIGVIKSGLMPVDILHAGFPCQSFSVAGDKQGFNDPRGRLFHEIIRIVKEFDENRPSVLLLENSPNLRIGEGGSWFLELSSQLKKSGYWFRDSNAVELDSYNHTGVPQKRNRLFMLAFATNRFRNGRIDLNFPLLENKKDIGSYIDFDGEVEDGSYYLEENNKYFKMISEKMGEPRSVLQLRKYEVRDKGQDTIPTLTANMGQGGHNVPFIMDKKGIRKLTEHECLRIQGFPVDFFFPPTVPRAKRYQQVGNSVVPPLVSLIAKAIRTKIEEERIE